MPNCCIWQGGSGLSKGEKIKQLSQICAAIAIEHFFGSESHLAVHFTSYLIIPSRSSKSCLVFVFWRTCILSPLWSDLLALFHISIAQHLYCALLLYQPWCSVFPDQLNYLHSSVYTAQQLVDKFKSLNKPQIKSPHVSCGLHNCLQLSSLNWLVFCLIMYVAEHDGILSWISKSRRKTWR